MQINLSTCKHNNSRSVSRSSVSISCDANRPGFKKTSCLVSQTLKRVCSIRWRHVTRVKYLSTGECVHMLMFVSVFLANWAQSRASVSSATAAVVRETSGLIARLPVTLDESSNRQRLNANGLPFVRFAGQSE